MPTHTLALTLAAAAIGLLAATPAQAAPACPSLLQHKMPRLQDEKPVDLCSYAGRVVLVVNTASQCGFTPQYKALQALHERYATRGLVIMGFPSGDFGGQELSSNEAIADFCENQFAVKFPMFAKSTVKPGGSTNPLFAALTAKTNSPPKWNFHKYLVSRDGATVISRPSMVDPLDPGFVREVERLLEQKVN